MMELRLVEYAVPEDPRSLGRKAGENMILYGVKINVRAEYEDGGGDKDRSNWSFWNDAALEALWLARRQ